jgi:arsenate reductase
MSETDTPVRVLFLSDGGPEMASMAASLLNARHPGRFEIYSTGMEAKPISPRAIGVMRDIGIDISSRPLTTLGDFNSIRFDHVVTLCDLVDNSCLDFPRDQDVTHWQIADPSLVQGTDEQVLEAYREAREALAVRVEVWSAPFAEGAP